MKIRETKGFKELVKKSGLPEDQFSGKIISGLVQNGSIDDTHDCWGMAIKNSVDGQVLVSALVDVLHGAGITHVTDNIFDAFLDLVLIGDGDCPECGGDMEVVEGEYKKIFGDGYYTPFEYAPIWEDRKCANCGYRD